MNKQKILKVILNTLAPPSDVVEGLISRAVKDKPTKEAENWLVTNSIWEALPDKQKKMFIAYCPDDLSWLTPNFVVKAVSKSNTTLASRILGSPSLQNRILEQIENIKAQLKKEV